MLEFCAVATFSCSRHRHSLFQACEQQYSESFRYKLCVHSMTSFVISISKLFIKTVID